MPQSRNLSGCQVLRPARLPNDWRCVPLKRHIELLYGRALKRDDRIHGDVDVFGSNGKVGTHEEHWLEGSGVLVGRKGSVGAVHYAERPYWPIDTVYYVRLVNNDCLRYIYYLLDYLPLKLLNAATGVPGLSRRDAYALLGAFPRKDEQEAIARVLDAVDTVIEQTREALQRARAVKKSLVQTIFEKGLRKEKQRKTEIGVIPRSWNVLPVKAVVNQFQYGLSVAMTSKGQYPILRMGNIQAGDVLLEELKYVNLPVKTAEAYLLKRGDVLFNRTNSQEHVGKIGIYRSKAQAVFASYLIRLITDNLKVDNYYLGQLLTSHSAQCRIKRYATPGVEQVNINAKNLGRVLIPLPSGEDGLKEQEEIAAILEQADESVRSYGPVLAALTELKKSLMHDLLTGRVRVKNLNLDSMVKL